jgi:hypothetical protein
MSQPKIVAGDFLYYHDYNFIRGGPFQVHALLVKSVGRKYIHLNGGRRVEKDTLYEQPDFGSSVQYHRTRAEAQDQLHKEESFQRISSLHRYTIAKLNGDQLKRICDVLEGKAGWETLSTYV